MVEIEPASEKHVPELAELWKEYMVDQNPEDWVLGYMDLDASTEGFQRQMKSFMNRELEGFHVATLDGEVVGFSLSFRNAFGQNYIMKEQIGHIQVVHVKQGYRRRGIASMLIEETLRYLAGCGCSLVLSETGDVNLASRRMLEKHGFRETGKLVNYLKRVQV